LREGKGRGVPKSKRPAGDLWRSVETRKKKKEKKKKKKKRQTIVTLTQIWERKKKKKKKSDFLLIVARPKFKKNKERRGCAQTRNCVILMFDLLKIIITQKSPAADAQEGKNAKRKRGEKLLDSDDGPRRALVGLAHSVVRDGGKEFDLGPKLGVDIADEVLRFEDKEQLPRRVREDLGDPFELEERHVSEIPALGLGLRGREPGVGVHRDVPGARSHHNGEELVQLLGHAERTAALLHRVGIPPEQGEPQLGIIALKGSVQGEIQPVVEYDQLGDAEVQVQ
jgi:hypothetical protein